VEEIYTERKALKEYISFIREERRRLSDEYWKSIERLRQLDERIVPEDKNELINTLLSMISEQNKTVDNLRSLLSPHESVKPEIPVLEKENKIVDKVIEEQKIIDSISKKHVSYGDLGIMSSVIASFLKDKEYATLKEIEQHLAESKNYKVANFSNTMNRIIDVNPKIYRLKRGYYAYKHFSLMKEGHSDVEFSKEIQQH
jgi:seryl-tRNA synthetase